MQLNDTCSWNGRAIACGRAGTGPDLVLCHGTPFSSRVWSDYADALAGEFTVHLWDMPGYGQSSKNPDHAVDFGVQADAFEAVLDYWGLRRPHVIAHDFGGAVSLRATLYGSATYASLALVDVVAIPPSGSPFFRFVHDHPDTLGQLPPHIHDAVLRAYIGGASAGDLTTAELDDLVAPWMSDEGRPAFYRQIAHYDEQFLVDNERRLGELTIPVHVIWGADDAWIPVQTGHRLAQLIPGAAYTEIPSGGHLLQHDAPVALSFTLARWLHQHGDRR